MTTKPTIFVGGDPPLEPRFINYTTFHIAGIRREDPARVVAAYYLDGPGMTKDEWFICCQFAFCSPKEKTSDKLKGQAIATHRILNSGPRGGRVFVVPNGASRTVIREGLRLEAIKVAQAKRIRWMKDVRADELV